MTTIRNISLAAVTLAAVATFVLGENQKGDYTPSQLGSLQQADPVRKTTDTNYEVSAYPVLGPDLAPGDGLQEVRIHCSTCHSPRYITMQPPLSAAAWEAEVKKMNKTFGAAIPEDASQKIVAYLQAHYTPEKRQ
jgi:mono/diheme cytochrome c family protein